MSRVSRKFGALTLAVGLTAPALMGVASPASASEPCVSSLYVSYPSDYARITDTSGGCYQVGVRHKYNPAWSSNDYWTSWVAGGDIAQSPSSAELYQVQDYAY